MNYYLYNLEGEVDSQEVVGFGGCLADNIVDALELSIQGFREAVDKDPEILLTATRWSIGQVSCLEYALAMQLADQRNKGAEVIPADHDI